jgi:hypothetical protein
MSWSVCAMGMPGPVRASLASQFAYAKREAEEMPVERTTIEAIEMAVYSQLDWIGQRESRRAVRVISSGSEAAEPGPGSGKGPQVLLRIECLPEFLAHGRVEESEEA